MTEKHAARVDSLQAPDSFVIAALAPLRTVNLVAFRLKDQGFLHFWKNPMREYAQSPRKITGNCLTVVGAPDYSEGW
jgi:hypothetical protein